MAAAVPPADAAVPPAAPEPAAEVALAAAAAPAAPTPKDEIWWRANYVELPKKQQGAFPCPGASLWGSKRQECQGTYKRGFLARHVGGKEHPPGPG